MARSSTKNKIKRHRWVLKAKRKKDLIKAGKPKKWRSPVLKMRILFELTSVRMYRNILDIHGNT